MDRWDRVLCDDFRGGMAVLRYIGAVDGMLQQYAGAIAFLRAATSVVQEVRQINQGYRHLRRRRVVLWDIHGR